MRVPRKVPHRETSEFSAAMARDDAGPKFVERLAALGADPSCITPAEFAELVAADLKQWAEAVATAGIKQQ